MDFATPTPRALQARPLSVPNLLTYARIAAVPAVVGCLYWQDVPQHGPWLRIVVRDNGRGGATVNGNGSSSSGLAGLADRVGAVDGHLSIASPSGGPTAITIDLPTHS